EKKPAASAATTAKSTTSSSAAKPVAAAKIGVAGTVARTAVAEKAASSKHKLDPKLQLVADQFVKLVGSRKPGTMSAALRKDTLDRLGRLEQMAILLGANGEFFRDAVGQAEQAGLDVEGFFGDLGLGKDGAGASPDGRTGSPAGVSIDDPFGEG